MRKYLKNKKMVTLMVSVLATTLILTGTFAWSVRLFSTTGGLGVDYNYLVKLLDEDSDPLFVINKWESEKLNKKVYATSSYKDDDIATEYDEIMADSPDAIFRDTWVRIKLEETFMRNGTTSTTTITEMLGDTLKSSISNGKYFTFDIQATIKTISEWSGEHGRFWILDTDSGWLYWARPLLATTLVDGSNPELENQTTDHIIDTVELKLQPSGVWEYTIKATLEAMDVELQGYKEEGAWDDIDETHGIYPLFGDIEINPTNFPDDTFRTWIMDNIPEATDGILTQKEISTITDLDISNQKLNHLEFTGINYFRNLERLDVSGNYLRNLDISGLTNLNETNFVYEPQYHNHARIPMILGLDTENRKEWAIDTNRYDQDLNVLFNEYNFPDAEFRAYLINTTRPDADNWLPSYIDDGKISQEDLANVKMVNVCYKVIENLKGIEHFPNLTHLFTHFTFLTSLDVSNNDALIQLYAYNNPLLTSLELGTNKPHLTNLWVSDSQLSRLDISGCFNATFRSNISNIDNFNYHPQLNANGTERTLKTPEIVTSSTLLEWE